MPVDCSMTNWFYNLIKVNKEIEGASDTHGGKGSSQRVVYGYSLDWHRLDLTWRGSAVIMADIDPMTLELVTGFKLRPEPRGLAWHGAETCSPPLSGCTNVCVCSLHLRRSCIVYSAHHMSKEWVSRGVLVEHWFSFIYHHTGEKKHPDVCVPGQREDPLRPTGVRPSCQQTWGGDHSLCCYFCRPNVIIKQLST